MAEIEQAKYDISTLNPQNESELAEIIRTLGYYVEHSEEGYIDVYGKSNRGMLTNILTIEQEVFDIMQNCGYVVKRVCFKGEFQSAYVVFIDAKNPNPNGGDNVD